MLQNSVEFDKKLISDFLGHLTVDNMFAFLVSKDFEDIADQEEKYFFFFSSFSLFFPFYSTLPLPLSP